MPKKMRNASAVPPLVPSQLGKPRRSTLELVAAMVSIVTVAVPEAMPFVTVTGEPEVTEQVGKFEAPLGWVAGVQARVTVPE
jgi:hypothetical protein